MASVGRSSWTTAVAHGERNLLIRRRYVVLDSFLHVGVYAVRGSSREPGNFDTVGRLREQLLAYFAQTLRPWHFELASFSCEMAKLGYIALHIDMQNYHHFSRTLCAHT